jgi:hypothetical protein
MALVQIIRATVTTVTTVSRAVFGFVDVGHGTIAVVEFGFLDAGDTLANKSF